MHGCAITNSHYLAHTRVLVDSFMAQHPGAGFSVLLIDDSTGTRHDDEPFQVLTPADIGIDEQEFNRRATMYITQGLTTSMKPNLLSALVDRGHETVLFLDADTFVLGDLSSLANLALHHGVVLSPHCLEPYPLWETDGPEQTFIRAGVMNAGLLGVGASGRSFLDWWARRTSRRCVFDQPRGLFLEQTWLMLAPALFHHHILRDRGCNVAGWNLHTRDVEWDGDVPTIDGGPLRHFHFAMSYDPEHPERLTASEHAHWWPTLDERPGVARLSREYAERLLAHGYREVRHTPPLFNAMPGGAPIEPWMRASYRAALIHAEMNGEAEPPNPFSHGEESFRAWIEPRTVERLVGASAVARPSQGAEGSSVLTGRDAGQDEPFSADEMAQAMMDSSKLLARIRELENMRDDAVAWAERVTADRDSTVAELVAKLERMQGVMEDVWHSPSWRVTRPLRSAKGLLSGRLRRRAS